MRKSPITVQQWVDTIPSNTIASNMNNNANFYSPPSKVAKKILPREYSLQSDDASSHCSSVESVLELRKPDPEAVLLELGFGPSKNSNLVSKIPSRFLQPSKLLTDIDIEKFLEHYGDGKYNDQHSAPSSPARTRPRTC